MNTLIQDIKKCTVDGNILRLPSEPLSDYPALKKALTSHNGTYKRNTFVFTENAQIYVDSITGGTTDFKKDRQFYETPKEVADTIINTTVPNMSEGQMEILEPSAGHGKLLDAAKREINQIDRFNFTMIEKDSFNFNVLTKKGYGELGNLIQDDFLTHDFKGKKFDYIYMNPPFTKGQDVEHITKAISLLKSNGGELRAIASTGITFNQQKKFQAFRNLLNKHEANIQPLDSGAFKLSGTMVNSVMIYLTKME